MTTIEATGIVAGYGARIVLDGCAARVSRGEVVSVVGPNGAGKSTLLRVLAGLLRPREGRVRIDGVDLFTFDRPALARRIAVVPQILETLFPFTVREIVALGRTARLGLLGGVGPHDARVVDDALATLDLGALAERRIDTLSGGERQRAVLAMALAQEADILLLDEPTVHLDPGHQLATLDLARRLARDRGLAVLAVLHDLNLAALTDRILVLAGGHVVRDGDPREVLTEEVLVPVFGPLLQVIAGPRPVVAPRWPDA